MYQYDLGIVIVNFNVRHFLVQCLQSIKNSEIRDLKVDIWVVDNASLDGSAGLIHKDFPEVRLIVNDKNLGFSAANNQALRKIDAKYVLLLNPDTVLEEDTLAQCFDFMEDHQQAGAIGVRMIDGNGKFLPESKRQVPNIWNSFCKLSYLSELFPRSKWFSGYNLGYLPENETNEIEILCGAFMFIRSEVLVKTGLLDEAFFMYGEDIDLSYRIIKSGYKIFYFPQTSIIHYKGESTKKGSLNYVRTFYGAMHIYVNKHFGHGEASAFSRFISLGITLRAFLSGAGRLFQSWVIPVIDILIIWILMSNIKYIWADFYFRDSSHYKTTNIDLLLFVYVLIWVFLLWLMGHYDKKENKYGIITGIGAGTVFILITYALLPEQMRTSRALILIGSIVTLCVVSLTKALFSLRRNKSRMDSTEKNLALVANKENAKKLLQIILKSDTKLENIHFISPTSLNDDPYYSSSIDKLPALVKVLKINEIIYSSEDVSMKEIIRSMTSMESEVSFRIGGDDSLSIIGSNNKNRQGELYSLDINYKLSDNQIRRYKRLTDVALVFLLLPVFPLLIIASGFRLSIIQNMIEILIGYKTWIGYGGEASDFSFLPVLKPGVIKYPLASGYIHYQEDHFKKMNIIYAREYSFLNEIILVFNNFHHLSNR